MDRRPDRRRGPVATGSRTRRPLRRFLPLLVLGLAVVAGGSSSAGAHSVLESSRPSDGTTVGASSGTVTLTFSEAPDPSLSTVQLTDHLGRIADLPDATAAPDDPTTLVLRTGDLGRGAYTVVWRVVSRLDGHATAGSLSFGVQVPPLDRSATVGEADAPVPVSVLEVVGRWLLITGLIVSFGAAAAVALVLDDPPPRTWLLVGGAAAVAGLGLVLLAVAQRAAAGVGLGPFLWTTVGTAVLGRALALAVVAAGVVGLERRTASSMGPLLVALGAAGAMFVDAAAGHAAAAPTLAWAAIALQATHLAAVGILDRRPGHPADRDPRRAERHEGTRGPAVLLDRGCRPRRGAPDRHGAHARRGRFAGTAHHHHVRTVPAREDRRPRGPRRAGRGPSGAVGPRGRDGSPPAAADLGRRARGGDRRDRRRGSADGAGAAGPGRRAAAGRPTRRDRGRGDRCGDVAPGQHRGEPRLARPESLRRPPDRCGRGAGEGDERRAAARTDRRR